MALGKTEEALAAADAALADPEPQAGAPPRLFRERKEWLGLRERCLRREKKTAEADAVREEIFKRPPRDPALGPKHLDLSAYYNAGIYDGRDWHGEVSLSTLPESFRPRDGVRFDIRGMIQLNSGVIPGFGKDLNGIDNRTYPYQVTGVPVGLKTQALHFLVSACYDQAKDGAEVGRIVVRYEDGLEAPVSLKQVEDVADWAVGEVHKINPDRVAWIGGRPAVRMVQRKTWKNPHPEKTIREIDFVSARGAGAPFLIAVTAE